MIGLDANILLRAATLDDSVQSPIATRIMSSPTREVPGYINTVALAESAWSLERRYDNSRALVCASIRSLMISSSIVFAEREAVDRALQRSDEEALDFQDALNCELNLTATCSTTVTFDRKSARSGGFSPAR
jgi:predicted nucleic-acid-binding protein